MDSIQASRWLHRIYRMLKEAEEDKLVRVRLNRNMDNYGEIEFTEPATITLNPSRRSFVSTIVHECIHLCDLDMSERKVMNLEKVLVDALTDRQLGNLLKRVARLI